MRCEDYPCCGHEQGDCPDAEGRFTCVSCGRKLAKNATSSICPRCTKRRVWDRENDWDGEGY
jgi:hypothetical protein